MGQMDTKEIEQSRTPEALYRAVEKYTVASSGSNHESAYREARNALIRFRKVFSKLPEPPDHPKDAIAGLQDVMNWCIRAIDIVDHMVDDIDGKVIDGFIRNLNKLKGLPASGFPKIHKDVLKKAEDRAQRILDKYQAGKKPPKGLDINMYCRKRTKFLNAASIISRLVEVANRKTKGPNMQGGLVGGKWIPTTPLDIDIYHACTEMDFVRAIERIYRLTDPDYTTALAKLEEGIFHIFEEWNRLNATDTDGLLDKYDELKGLKLQDRITRLASAYSIDAIVDTALFGSKLDLAFGNETRDVLVDGIIETLYDISGKIKRKSQMKQSQNSENAEKGVLTMPTRSSKDNWEAVKSEYDVSKKDFGRKINFVSDSFKREIIFRDVEHAFVLASEGFSKPATILAGGVIEELLRLYLECKNIKPMSDDFNGYIKTCEQEGLLKSGISRLSDSVRHFRNLVHLGKEETERYTISKATAKGAVSSIFTIANDFQ